jgi:hypothetical protein
MCIHVDADVVRLGVLALEVLEPSAGLVHDDPHLRPEVLSQLGVG